MTTIDQDSDDQRFDNPEHDGEFGDVGVLDAAPEADLETSLKSFREETGCQLVEGEQQSHDSDPASLLRAGVQERLNRLFEDQEADSEEVEKSVAEVAAEGLRSHDDQVFPPEVFSSASVPGARRVRSNDPRALDLRIEGLLFVTNVPMTVDEIARVLEVDVKDARDTLAVMVKSFSRRRSALELRERMRRGRPAFIIDLKPQYRPDVKPLVPPSLPRRILETLAIIAMNQPMNQARLVRDLGTKVYDHVRELIERGLISKTREGISYTLRTTPRFSSEFGLSGNPRDLRSMLARKMTPTELEAWDHYQKIHQNNPLAAAAAAYDDAAEQAAEELRAESEVVSIRRPIPVGQELPDSEFEPVEGFAHGEDRPLEAAEWQREMEAALNGSPEALREEHASKIETRETPESGVTQAGSTPLASSGAMARPAAPSVPKSEPAIDANGRSGSGPVLVRGERTSSETILVDASALDLPEPRKESLAVDVSEAEAELGRPMTRFEKLFLELKNKRR